MAIAGAAKVIASALALAGFAVAVLSGLTAGNPATHVLGAAMLAMVVCYLTGLCVGAVAELVIAQHLESIKAVQNEPRDGGQGLEPGTPAGGIGVENAG